MASGHLLILTLSPCDKCSYECVLLHFSCGSMLVLFLIYYYFVIIVQLLCALVHTTNTCLGQRCSLTFDLYCTGRSKKCFFYLAIVDTQKIVRGVL